jgi:four helix bundle protein
MREWLTKEQMEMRNINDYDVFKKSHQLTLRIYKICKDFPKEEIYGLTAQMKRSAYSIPMNLKEGGAGTELEFFRYARIAYASKEELDYQLLLAKDLGYINEDLWKKLLNDLNDIGKMLYRIITKHKDKK